VLIIDVLNTRTRELMAEAWANDTYHPANLTHLGYDRYHETAARHLADGDFTSLYAEVAQFPHDCLQTDKRGALPVDWARRLTMTDYLSLWNCARARELLEQGETHGMIIRIGEAYVPRGTCLELEGLAVPLELVAQGFRAKYHPAPNRDAFSLPVGPNCHHGIRALTEAEKAAPSSERNIGGALFLDYGVR
jgi:hypothetical protein